MRRCSRFAWRFNWSPGTARSGGCAKRSTSRFRESRCRRGLLLNLLQLRVRGGDQRLQFGLLTGQRFLHLTALSLLLPAVLDCALHGWTLDGFVRGLVWGGLVRAFLLHHVTWSINSVCHFFGRRRFDVEDRSTNVAWLAVPSLGEAWHHNHHAFPRSAEHGLRRWELDPSAVAIRVMERAGLAWNVVRITRERQQQRLAAS